MFMKILKRFSNPLSKDPATADGARRIWLLGPTGFASQVYSLNTIRSTNTNKNRNTGTKQVQKIPKVSQIKILIQIQIHIPIQ